MSSDYDRLFYPPADQGMPTDDATVIRPRDPGQSQQRGYPTQAAPEAGAAPQESVQCDETPPERPIGEEHEAAANHGPTLNPEPLPLPPESAPQWPQNFGQSPQQQLGHSGRHERPASPARPDQWSSTAPPPAAAQWPAAAPTPGTHPWPTAGQVVPQGGGIGAVSAGPRWETGESSVGQGSPPQGQPGQAAGPGRAIDGLSEVGIKAGVKAPPQRGWRHWLYASTRINLGPSPDEIYESELNGRIRRNARDFYQIGILGLKGGAGKTAVTVALGSAMAKVRGDRILAIDADPDAGNLADRVGRQSAATIADLLANPELSSYNDIRGYTSMNRANLEALPSADYTRAGHEFDDKDWAGATAVVSRYYNLVLADTGTGLLQKSARAVLSTVSGAVIVASASIDGARQAAITMDWLGQNGYQKLLGRSCVVINHITPGKPNVDIEDLVQQFERHVPAGRVIVLPYDKHIATGAEIQFDLLGKKYRRRITELAAALSDDFGIP